MLRPLPLPAVGEGEHRSGWPYCVDALQSLFSNNSPIIFDDFIERSFLYRIDWAGNPGHKRPWIGCLHHPPDMPDGYFDNLHLHKLLINKRWMDSLRHLKMLITFAPNTAEWCRQQWPDIPVAVTRHPTGRPLVYWSPERFRRNKAKKVAQVGWFLRNTMAIYQVSVPAFYQKVHLQQDRHFIEIANSMCRNHQPTWYPGRRLVGDVTKQLDLTNLEYDLFLSENVVFVELISAAANNTVVECIARNTPICVNRHLGPVHYLGKDYPLFFDNLNDVPYLLTEQNVLAAHYYLKKLDKWWIRGGMFCEHIREICSANVAECKQTTPVGNKTLFSI